jgi:hypothetical protein
MEGIPKNQDAFGTPEGELSNEEFARLTESVRAIQEKEKELFNNGMKLARERNGTPDRKSQLPKALSAVLGGYLLFVAGGCQTVNQGLKAGAETFGAAAHNAQIAFHEESVETNREYKETLIDRYEVDHQIDISAGAGIDSRRGGGGGININDNTSTREQDPGLYSSRNHKGKK